MTARDLGRAPGRGLEAAERYRRVAERRTTYCRPDQLLADDEVRAGPDPLRHADRRGRRGISLPGHVAVSFGNVLHSVASIGPDARPGRPARTPGPSSRTSGPTSLSKPPVPVSRPLGAAVPRARRVNEQVEQNLPLRSAGAAERDKALRLAAVPNGFVRGGLACAHSILSSGARCTSAIHTGPGNAPLTGASTGNRAWMTQRLHLQ